MHICELIRETPRELIDFPTYPTKKIRLYLSRLITLFQTIMSQYRFYFIIFIIAILPIVQVTGQNYQRIISLAPSLTKNIYFLNSQDKLIGCTSYCEDAKPDNKEIVASAIQVNIEKVIKLKPDLVIATTITGLETIEKIKKFNIKVETFSSPASFEKICDQFKKLGELTNKKELADKIIHQTKTKVDSLKQVNTWEYPPRIFFQIGAKPLFTVIPNTFMNDLIQFAGGINIAADLTRGSISRESVITRNPDVILIVTMGILGMEEKKKWQGFEQLSATKNKKIFIIDASHACEPTPISFQKALEIIVNLLKNE